MEKSGFVGIIGKPNVGKSTLINAFIGQKIAIVSNKPQTTRNKIIGIYTDEETQIVFTDTPGYHKPKTELGRFMVKGVNEAINDTDLILLIIDARVGVTGNDESLIQKIKSLNLPAIAVINKIDLVKKEDLLPIISCLSELYSFEEIVPISALKKDYVLPLLNKIKDYINPGPMFYPEDMVTDQPEKQVAAEIVREKLLRLLDKEVPHGIAIEIQKMREYSDYTKIWAVIHCEKKSHKGIIIGKDGEMIKNIGIYAREDIEKMLGVKVNLELWVKVKQDWRNNKYEIKNFGYE